MVLVLKYKKTVNLRPHAPASNFFGFPPAPASNSLRCRKPPAPASNFFAAAPIYRGGPLTGNPLTSKLPFLCLH